MLHKPKGISCDKRYCKSHHFLPLLAFGASMSTVLLLVLFTGMSLIGSAAHCFCHLDGWFFCHIRRQILSYCCPIVFDFTSSSSSMNMLLLECDVWTLASLSVDVGHHPVRIDFVSAVTSMSLADMDPSSFWFLSNWYSPSSSSSELCSISYWCFEICLTLEVPLPLLQWSAFRNNLAGSVMSPLPSLQALKQNIGWNFFCCCWYQKSKRLVASALSIFDGSTSCRSAG